MQNKEDKRSKSKTLIWGVLVTISVCFVLQFIAIQILALVGFAFTVPQYVATWTLFVLGCLTFAGFVKFY